MKKQIILEEVDSMLFKNTIISILDDVYKWANSKSATKLSKKQIPFHDDTISDLFAFIRKQGIPDDASLVPAETSYDCDGDVILTWGEDYSKDISDINIRDLAGYIEEQGIPQDAMLELVDRDGYDYCSGLALEWNEKTPMDAKNRDIYVKKQFMLKASKAMTKEMNKQGYTLTELDPKTRQKFANTDVYQMYKEKDFDALYDYYSSRFKK